MKKIFTLCVSVFIVFSAFSQAQRLVLFEEFTGENCPPCAGTNPYLYTLVNDYSSEVVLIHYLSPIPTAGILSDEVNSIFIGRGEDFYDVGSTPWGEQDGVIWDSTLLTSSQDPHQPYTWCANNDGSVNATYLNNEYAIPSPFNITVSDTLTGVTDSFYATVTLTAAEAWTATGPLKLQVAMVEDIQFNTPPGNNGETFWSNAVRAMYPSTNGTTISSSWANNQTSTYTFKGKMPVYNGQELIRDKTKVRFVAFVQEEASQNIEQTGISNYTTLDLDIATTGFQANFANCYHSQFTPVINLTNAGTEEITSCYVYEFVDGVFLDSVLWSGELLGNGSTLNATLPALTIAPGTHNLQFVLESPNYLPDQNVGNDTASITLVIPVTDVDPPYVEGFENGDPTTNGDGWGVESPDHDSTWRVCTYGDNSAHSYQLPLGFDNFGGDEFVVIVNNLYAPPLNLTYAAHATVTFNFANQWVYFGLNEGDSVFGLDSLYIDVSADCGNTWSTVYANSIRTARAQTYGSTLTEFLPSAGQWGNDSADLSVVANHDDVLLRFRPTTDDGNDFFLDNINIYKYDSVPYNPPTVIDPVSNLQSVSIFPNPANDVVNINVELSQSLEVAYQVIDITGNVIATCPPQNKFAGQNMISLNTSSLADGAYFVTLVAGNEKVTKMIAVTH